MGSGRRLRRGVAAAAAAALRRDGGGADAEPTGAAGGHRDRVTASVPADADGVPNDDDTVQPTRCQSRHW